MYRFLSSLLRLVVIAVLSLPVFSPASEKVSLTADSLLKKMESAYAQVGDYQANIEVKNYKSDGSSELKKFLYTFKKPKLIRLDFESPYPGMVMVYPDKSGKVAIRRPGIAHFFTLHLSPENHLIKVSSGQRIDQTDLGLLIQNISHSVTDHRRGEVGVDENNNIRIRVLSTNHFHKNVVTLYQFFIDKHLWLPVKVEESTPQGQLERTITFQNLRINIGTRDSFFQIG